MGTPAYIYFLTKLLETMTSSFFFSQEGITVGEQDLSSALNREETLPALELTTSSTKKNEMANFAPCRQNCAKKQISYHLKMLISGSSQNCEDLD